MDNKIAQQFQERRKQITEQKMFISSLIQNLENEMKNLDEKYSLIDKEQIEYYKSLKTE